MLPYNNEAPLSLDFNPETLAEEIEATEGDCFTTTMEDPNSLPNPETPSTAEYFRH